MAAAAVVDMVSVPTSLGAREPVDLASKKLNFQRLEVPDVSLHQCATKYGPQLVRSIFEKLTLREEEATFEEINLSDNRIGDDGARYLAEGLTANKSLQRLLLPRTGMRVQGAKSMGRIIETCPSLVEIVLSGNFFDAEGVTGEFCHGLSKTTSLRSLYLAACRLGDKGVHALADGPLRLHPSLEHVSLAYNRLEVDAAKHLGGMLAHNKVLRHLDLSGNTLGPAGAKAIVDGLKKNGGVLKRLSVAQNQIVMDGAKAFVQHFQSAEGKALEFLDLRHNLVPYPGVAELRRLLGKPLDHESNQGWMMLFGERQLLLNTY